MTDADGKTGARIVPCEIDGDTMYAGGRVLRRGRYLGLWDNIPLWEWDPVPVDPTPVTGEE